MLNERPSINEFNRPLACEMWGEVFDRGFGRWPWRTEVIRIAGECGLGVLSIEAMDFAATYVKSDYKERNRYSAKRFEELNREDACQRWAECLRTAATNFPAPTEFPILE